MNSERQAVMGVSSLAFDGTGEKLTVLQFGVMERRSFGTCCSGLVTDSQSTSRSTCSKERFAERLTCTVTHTHESCILPRCSIVN